MNRAVVLGAAGLAGLYLWSRSQASAAQAVDPRWLAQQDLARRQNAGSATPATDTLGMVLKLGGAALAIGGTGYKILSQALSSGSEGTALTALTKYISDGPTGMTTGLAPDATLSDALRSWQTTPPPTPGGVPAITISPVEAPTIIEVSQQLAPGEPPIPSSQIPVTEPAIITEPIPPSPTNLSAVPVIEAPLTIPSFELTLPGSFFDPSALDGATGAVQLGSDGLVRLSITTEEFTQASNLVHLWESGQLDLSLLPADKAMFLQDNLPMLKKFTESGGDFGIGEFSSPVGGDTIMKAMPEGAPTTIDAALPATSIKDILNTPVWTTTKTVFDEFGNPAIIESVTTISDVLSVAGPVITIAVAAVGMYMTITGDLPDYQKAVYCALDAASIALALISLFALAIPVAGWIIAAAIQIVVFVLKKVWGDQKSHEQREAEETAYLIQYGAQELSKQLAQVMTLKSLHAVLVSWGSGYTGGTSAIAIMCTVTVNNQSLIVGVPNPAYAVAGPGELAVGIDSLTVGIQGGVAPQFLEGANASLKNLIQALVPLMWNARRGDFPATAWLVTRALNLYWPVSQAKLRYAPGLVRMKDMFPEYPWWNEVILQTGYSLQANLWGYETWLTMLNAIIGQDIGHWSTQDMTAFAKRFGASDFHLWRSRFFAFEEPVSQAMLAGPVGQAKLDELARQAGMVQTVLAIQKAEAEAATATATEAAYWQQQAQYISL